MRRPHPILWFRRHWQLADVLFGVAVTLIATAPAMILQGEVTRGQRPPDGWAILLAFLMTIPIVVRRRWPIAVLWACLVPQMVFSARDYVDGGGWAGVLVAVYSVGAHVVGRRRIVHGTAFGAAALGFVLLGVLTNSTGIGSLISTAITMSAAFLIGDNLRRRRERVAHLAERADRAERERDLLARQRVGEERTRIARELHDVVAHSVSVMVIQAGAARRQLANDPARATAALEVIEANGRQAMDEMRRVLGVLRSGADFADARQPQLEPAPSMRDVGALVDADPYRLTSLDLYGSVDDLPAGVDLSAYRIVQEALTNVRKHAGPGARTSVAVRRRPDELHIVVADDGRGASAPAAETPGFGIVGMRERVAMCGGTLDAGPRRGGGWQVTASFPLVPFAPPDQVADPTTQVASRPLAGSPALGSIPA